MSKEKRHLDEFGLFAREAGEGVLKNSIQKGDVGEPINTFILLSTSPQSAICRGLFP